MTDYSSSLYDDYNSESKRRKRDKEDVSNILIWRWYLAVQPHTTGQNSDSHTREVRDVAFSWVVMCPAALRIVLPKEKWASASPDERRGPKRIGKTVRFDLRTYIKNRALDLNSICLITSDFSHVIQYDTQTVLLGN